MSDALRHWRGNSVARWSAAPPQRRHDAL